jgi:serine protease Do
MKAKTFTRLLAITAATALSTSVGWARAQEITVPAKALTDAPAIAPAAPGDEDAQGDGDMAAERARAAVERARGAEVRARGQALRAQADAARAVHDGMRAHFEALAEAQAAGAGATGGGGNAPRAFTLVGPRARTEKGTFLGIRTSQVTPALREQIKLQNGVGLVVEQVEKGSPAEEAGLKQYDIIQKIDDQLLVNSQQLAVLVRLYKPGDTATLTVIRQGDRQNIKAKLVEHDVPVTMDGNVWEGGFLAPGNVVKFNNNNGVFQGMGVGFGENDQSNANMVFQDPKHRLEVTVKDHKKHLLAKDVDGKVVFDGPIDTDEQRKAVPADVAEKLVQLEGKASKFDIEKSTIKVIEP